MEAEKDSPMSDACFRTVQERLRYMAQVAKTVVMRNSLNAGADRIEQLDRAIEDLTLSNAKVSASNGQLRADLALANEQHACTIDVLEQTRRDLAAAQGKVGRPSIRDVLSERERQVSQEGWTPEHDDEHEAGDLCLAGACYAMHTTMMFEGNQQSAVPSPWPFEASWWKPKDERRNLVRAAALILAEIERIDRAALAEDRHEQ